MKDRYGWLKDQGMLTEQKRFEFYDFPDTYTQFLYVSAESPAADDGNPGTRELPFRTIARACRSAVAGTCVVIGKGVYRESIRPLYSGRADAPVCFCAAGDGEAVISGARVYEGEYTVNRLWKNAGKGEIYMADITGYTGQYNPFALNQFPNDLFWIYENKLELLRPFLLSRGKVLADGEELRQYYSFADLAAAESGFCTEKNGLAINIKLKGGENPSDHRIELVVADQLFCPAEQGFSYIKVKGLRFHACANCFPVPQEGAVSANRGHHFCFEENTVDLVEGIGLECGKQSWNSPEQEINGYNIIRNNCFYDIGICAIGSFICKHTLIENNYIENVGYKEVEFMGENAAIKLHVASDSLVRNNIIRNLGHALGIWLDFTNTDCRVSGNFLENITSGNGGIMFEANRERCVLDGNVLIDMHYDRKDGINLGHGGNGYMAFGSDDTLIYGNLFYGCEGAGIFVNMVKNRMAGGRGGTGCGNCCVRNIVAACGRAAVEIPHEKNELCQNIYCAGKGGYIRIGTHDRPYSKENVELDNIRLDLHAFQKIYKNDEGSAEEEFVLQKRGDVYEVTCGKRALSVLKELSSFKRFFKVVQA